MRRNITSWLSSVFKAASRKPYRFRRGMSRDRKSRIYSRHPQSEHLEDRVLLAVVWANEFGTGASNPNFGIYGANEVYARALVNRSISDWNNVVLDQNWDNDNNPATNGTFTLNVFATELSGARGATGINAVTSNLPGIDPEVVLPQSELEFSCAGVSITPSEGGFHGPSPERIEFTGT